MNEARWIPITERKPPEYVKVLMSVHELNWDGTESDHVECRVYSEQTNIRAWMELPEPYKGE